LTMATNEIPTDPTWIEENVADTEAEEVDDRYTYWANKAPEDLASEVVDRAAGYYESLKKNGVLDLWRRVYCAYYNLDEGAGEHGGSRVRFAGDVGEVVLARAGHLRSLVQYLLVTTTAHRLNYQPRAVNTDYKSKAQTYAAKSLLDYYEREKRLGRKHKSVALRALLYGMGHLWQGWDPSAGDVVMPEVDGEGNPTGRRKHEGDIVAKAKSPIDVVHDLRREINEQDWFIVRDPANKYDLAVKYPEKREDIMDSEPLGEEEDPRLFRSNFAGADDDDERCGADDVVVWHFYHRRTDAMPKGRYLTCIDSETWLYDGPLPYEDMPVHTMYPDEFLETSFGYTTAWDLISNDELFDAILSTICTTVDAFGMPNIALPDGSELTVEEVSGGLNLIHYPQGMDPPRVLEFNKMDQSLIKLLEFLQSNSEVRSGVNSVARGQLDSNITSGTMAALVQAQALHFNSGLEQSYIALVEDSGTALLRLFKQYARVPRMIQIVGANGQGPVMAFSNKNVEHVDRVIVDAGNPLERSIAGKESMAATLVEKGLITQPELYFEVLATGRLDSRRLPHQITMDAITQENEILASGQCTITQTEDTSEQQAQPQQPGMPPAPPPQPKMRDVIQEVPVLPTDNHRMHIFWHSVEATEPSERTNAELLKIRLTHIHDHMWHIRFGDPLLQQVLGYDPGPPPGGPPGGGNAPKPGGMPLAPEPNRPGGSAVELPGQPGMPENPVAM